MYASCSLTGKSSQGLPEHVEVRTAADYRVKTKSRGDFSRPHVYRSNPIATTPNLIFTVTFLNALDFLPLCPRRFDWLSLRRGSVGSPLAAGSEAIA